MKRKNIIIWTIAAVAVSGFLWLFFMLSIAPGPAPVEPGNQHVSSDSSYKKTDEKQHLPPLDVPKKSIASLHLGLELKGTMVSDAPEPLAVIFKIKEKREILVKEGDAIDSVVVHKIMKEKVLLQVKDQWAILLLKNKKTAPAENDEQTASRFNHTADITWSDIDSISENLWDLGRQVRLFPRFARGRLDGFRVSGMAEESFFSKKLGLENGDIISGVNGKKIQSLKDIPNIYDLFEQLESTGTMEINIKRDKIAGKIKVLIE